MVGIPLSVLLPHKLCEYMNETNYSGHYKLSSKKEIGEVYQFVDFIDNGKIRMHWKNQIVLS